MKYNFLGGIFASLFILSCSQKNPEPEISEINNDVSQVEKKEIISIETHAEATKEPASTSLIDKGRRLYISNCISCHNKDPNVKGPIGPEIIDAPLEIMTAKIMTGKYPDLLPEGFKPKRTTKLMRPITKLKDDIPAIYEYVQSMKKKN
jgi:mono/diheme cytochrome c family protein